MCLDIERCRKGFVASGTWLGARNPEHLNNWIVKGNTHLEFDPGSGRTLAVRLMHASRTRTATSVA